jgi:hypothetical protein
MDSKSFITLGKGFNEGVGTQTLGLRFMRQMFNHCATVNGLVNKVNYFQKSFIGSGLGLASFLWDIF